MMRLHRMLLAVALVAALPQTGLAEKKYGPGVTDTEIKIGQTMPYSGPASAYGTIGRAQAAFFAMINEQGGVNGRKINLISLDDGYSPPKTVEQTRKLVEQEEVLLLFSPLGTPTNSAIHKYVNAKGVPHIFLTTGATKWGDPKNFPWTMGFILNYQAETHIYATHLLKTRPDAKLAILYQNDDAGKDTLKGLKDGLGDKAPKMIVAEVSYEVTDPTIDSQIVSLKASGADTFFQTTIPKFAAQAIRKIADIGWKPQHFLLSTVRSIATVLTPAGLDKSVGLITALYAKDPTDPQWKNDADMKAYMAWMKKYYPEGDPNESNNVVGYITAKGLVHVLKACGDNLTRQNVMKQMTSIRDLQVPMMLPGIKWNTSPEDYFLIESAQLARFDGKTWVLFGEVIGK